ncbi:MAG: co-chaperone GroES [Candidatus Rokuibacteriota bacterium]
MKIQPLHDRVLIRRVEEEAKTQGGIIIPDTAKEKPQEGVVVATGKGKVRDDGRITPIGVAAGDRVLFSKYSGNDVTLAGEDYTILREEDVLAVVDGAGAGAAASGKKKK